MLVQYLPPWRDFFLEISWRLLTFLVKLGAIKGIAFFSFFISISTFTIRQNYYTILKKTHKKKKFNNIKQRLNFNQHSPQTNTLMVKCRPSVKWLGKLYPQMKNNQLFLNNLAKFHVSRTKWLFSEANWWLIKVHASFNNIKHKNRKIIIYNIK